MPDRTTRSTGAIVALVLGCLLVPPAVGLILAGAGVGARVAAQGEDGYFGATLNPLISNGVAVTAEGPELVVEANSPGWLIGALSVDTRLEVTGAGERAVFVGVARQADLDAYLEGAAHAEVADLTGRTVGYLQVPGAREISSPADQAFWDVSATGPGTQTLDWAVQDGRWAVAIMNADGSPDVAADVNVGVRARSLLPLVTILLVLGHGLVAVAVTLILIGANGSRTKGRDAVDTVQAGASPPLGATAAAGTLPAYPVSLHTALDPELSRGLWLVKWILAIPHYFILAFLWSAFVLLASAAFVSILVTGTYPRAIFDFNVGVMRWSYRVAHYAGAGGLGTDRYPPFSLDDDPSYPVHLDVVYPERLSRGLVLVKWWLLAIPHYLVVALLVGGSFQWLSALDWNVQFDVTNGGGVLGLLAVVAGLFLLFAGRYPQGLYDVIIGLNRWVYRVIAYASLMTDQYPPFRLDQGGSEPPALPIQPRPNDRVAPRGRETRVREPATTSGSRVLPDG